MTATTEFTFSAYASSLERAVNLGILFITYDDIRENLDKKKCHFFLRHDCERDLNKALKMGDVEHSLGVKSTYFVRLKSEYYNILDSKSLGILEDLQSMGHGVGLHYEPAAYLNEKVEFKKGLSRDISILEALLGNRVDVVSPHQPSLTPPDFDAVQELGVVDVYTDADFKRLIYYSDSGMVFREKTLDKAIEEQASCQFLIHPDFWNDVNISWTENIDDLLARVVGEMKDFCESEKRVVAQYLFDRETLDKRFQENTKNV